MPAQGPRPARRRVSLAAEALCLTGFGAAQAASAPVNLARTGTASQRSTCPDGDAWNAIDGNPQGAWRDGSVARSNLQSNPCRQMRLPQHGVIATVVLCNRTDCCTGRLSDVWLTRWNDRQQEASQWVATAPAPSASFQFDRVLADPVRPQRNVTDGDLAAAGVQVSGQVSGQMSAVPDPRGDAP